MSRSGWIALTIAAAVAVGLFAARSHFLPADRRLQPPPPADTSAAPETDDLGEPFFARWLSFEPATLRDTPGLDRRYIDASLGHQIFRLPPSGIHPQLARQLLLDDDKLLLSSGRHLWTRELLHEPGMVGEFCYLHSTYCLERLFSVAFSIDGVPTVVYANQIAMQRYPSHTIVRYILGGVRIDEHKFITYDDRAIAWYEVSATDGKAHQVALEAFAPRPPLPGGGQPTDYPLLGAGSFQGLPLFLYLDAPNFERLEGDQIHLRDVLDVPADGAPASTGLAYRFDSQRRDTPPSPPDRRTFNRHVDDYNRWFADNVPYFDCSDFGFKRMWYYRWWIVRFHLVDLRDAPTQDLRDYAFYEGKLGFDNVIGFAVPAQTKELTYLRDPAFARSQLRNSYRNRAANGAVVDPPGSPYWGETYSHWNAMAAAELHRVQPIDPETLRELLPEIAADVRAWLSAYDGDGDALPEYALPRVTGYDLDILSWWYFAGTVLDQSARPPALERADFASFVYANAAAGAELATAAGDEALAAELGERADAVRAAALAKLWDDDTGFFYPQRASDDVRVPIRELHGFFPFMALLAPDEPRYARALRYFVDPAEFWARYPPVITSQEYYRTWTWEMDGLTRNIAPHPISMGARTLLQAIKHYDQPWADAAHFMELLRRYNDLVYPGVHPGDPYWRPNVHEYYSQWEPHAQTPRPKPSDISHDFHSMYLSLIVEGAVGLTPRRDARIELQPLATEWSYFLLDGLRHRGHDLTIVWDRPGDGPPQYDGYGEGFSLYVDGARAFNVAALAHVIFDPASGELEVVGAAAAEEAAPQP